MANTGPTGVQALWTLAYFSRLFLNRKFFHFAVGTFQDILNEQPFRAVYTQQ
jgi:hypothetical protein